MILSDVASRKPLDDPLEGHQDTVAGVDFSLDGKTLASASWDKTVILWDLGLLQEEHENFASLLRRACTIANRNLTHGEWAQFVGAEVPYQAPCPELPLPKD